MIVSVPKEPFAGERRVALTPDVVKRLVAQSVEVRIEHDAGFAASHLDAAYEAVGAKIVQNHDAIWREADIVLCVQRPMMQSEGRDEIALLKEGAVVIGMMYPLLNHPLVKQLAARKVTSFSLDQLPRITRAQTMDVLSSMATIAGYRAVLLAASQNGKFFPMLVTAAGTVAPAKVFIVGAGVAGLQAIATAKRLGAVVHAFDVRPAVKEQIESLGAKFMQPEADLSAEGAGGYAKELSADQKQAAIQFMHQTVQGMDVVITTALVPGKPAPRLITADMVKDMRPGSVIVDLAAEMGGNCELTKKGETIEVHGVTIMGPLNLPAGMPVHASQMYAKNLQSFLGLIVNKEGKLALDFEDEIVKGTCITHEGRVAHEATQKAMEG
ncbi:MAG: Re/Si-specific NAD(P)(+) transhydrogenase subunit alpha [Gemmatimonadales bacterium]|nr:Re/Si-specific NAD(P)(+) transhydrogenase subunit alpha [Gemmatimonadales bacterium]